jgi:hypothetical protein
VSFTIEIPGGWRLLSLTIDPGPWNGQEAGPKAPALNLVPCEHSQRIDETRANPEALETKMAWAMAGSWSDLAAYRLKELVATQHSLNEIRSGFEEATRDAVALGAILYQIAEALEVREEPFGGVAPERILEAIHNLKGRP